MLKVIALFMVFTLTGCSTVDYQLTSFRLNKSESGYSIYTFKAFSDAVYPLNSESAEQTRMEWLKKWLEQNNLSTTNYEIIGREEYVKNKGLLGTVYDLYYEVKVPLKSNAN